MQVRRTNPRGVALIYLLISMIAVTGFISLAVDVSHVRLVKIQLQDAADSAVRVGARNMGSGVTGVQNAVVAAAAVCQADGSSVVVDANNDIDFGTWSNNAFTVLTGASRSSANAIRVRCSRTAAKGNAVVAYFGSLIGISTSNVSAQATASGTAPAGAGFIGYNGITAKNKAFFGGYNSAVTTNPTENSCDSNMSVGSNATISGNNKDTIEGDLQLGPSATNSGFTVQGSNQYPGSNLTPPTLPTWSPGTNPNSIPQVYSVSSNTTLPGGTYWFTSLTVTANLTFSGAATIYINGDATIAATLTPASGVPGDLTIYQYGSNSFGDSTANGMNITGNIVAPGCDFTAKSNLQFQGSGLFNTITTKNNAEFFYDEAQGSSTTGYSVATVN